MSVIGKINKEEFNREEAREMAERVARRSNPKISKRKARKLVDKEEQRQGKRRGLGF